MKTGVIGVSLLFFLLAGTAAGTRADILNVQVRNGALRSKPSFLGQIVGSVSYGDRVTVIQEQGEWVLGRKGSGPQGWIHISALTDDEIELSAGSGTVETAASGDELALAGKGFNSDVEAEFKTRNSDIDFTWVDRMEKIIILPEQMEGFLKVGQVTAPGGGRR
ncbi:MAG: SH3 domain-containing protein [PVC group bacterium]